MNIHKIPKLKFQWLGTVKNGKRLEIIAIDKYGNEIKEVDYPIATILADENNEELLIEIYSEKKAIQIPISKLKEAFELSSDEVHSEKWYEENIYINIENS